MRNTTVLISRDTEGQPPTQDKSEDTEKHISQRRSYMSLHGKYTTHSQPIHRGAYSFESSCWHLFSQMKMYQVQMFFGRNIPDGGYVDDQSWQQYQVLLDEILDGMTILDGIGYWKGEQEKMKVISTSVEDEQVVDDLVAVYKQMFNQDSVAVQFLPPLIFK